MARRVRADVLVVEQGLAASRERARALILAGEVMAGETRVDKAGDLVAADVRLRLRSGPMPYVSRGGLKLAHALEAFAVAPAGRVALDVGASTGGFTDVLLQHAAAHVTCVDVGYGQLDAKIAGDARVRILDRTNIRHVTAADIEPFRPDLVVIDVSFISLRLVLTVVATLAKTGADVIALVKPQFEVGRGQVGKGGIVRDAAARRGAIDAVAEAARGLGFDVVAETLSPIEGGGSVAGSGRGNVEHFLHLRLRTQPALP